jgi:hypothetical protein
MIAQAVARKELDDFYNLYHTRFENKAEPEQFVKTHKREIDGWYKADVDKIGEASPLDYFNSSPMVKGRDPHSQSPYTK